MIAYVVSFFVGVATGVLGKYAADVLTDKRHKREEEHNAQEAFEKVRATMPDLISEISADLAGHPAIREFFVLPNKGAQINRPGPRFMHYEDEHEDLQGKTAILENRGYIVDVTPGNTPVYRMTEEFAALVMHS